MAADWRSGVVDRVRALIVKAEPDVVEEAKWRKASNPDGVPTFSHSGLICTVETYKEKVKITFARGASLRTSVMPRRQCCWARRGHTTTA